ncbi:MAG: hypothetical protein HRT65_02970 [Flavobacteriaceae bacterium]|nr:hypothetical protein [Flavobacteriaceae bacterium]
MAEHPKQTASDEIELGQLFQLMGSGFNKFFKGVLRLFLYLKRNALILIGLCVFGALLGLGLKQITNEKMLTEIIVRPNLDSREYLYDVIKEIQANIKSQNQSFFESMDIDIKEYEGVEIEVKSLGNKKSKLEDELKYLELLKGLDFSTSVSDIVRNEILSRNSLNHKISISYLTNIDGQMFAEKIMAYINSNPYFTDLIGLYRSNAEKRIEQNLEVIEQLDVLIDQYSKNLAEKDERSADSGRIILDNDDQVDIRRLFDLKNSLIADIENKKVEIRKQTEAIRIINFGRPHEVIKPFFGKTIVLIPLVLIGAFFVFSMIKYLNRKSAELL